eukprot:SAG31_NODE_16429_length_709_cov_2.927869_1_plen_70_part_00
MLAPPRCAPALLLLLLVVAGYAAAKDITADSPLADRQAAYTKLTEMRDKGILDSQVAPCVVPHCKTGTP